ncbi:MAG: hypothetical protein M3542_02340 [Acidobacteriota bacterium]|nr:hypothetical protein [Acidobacteriota bacterium]
MKTRKLKRTSIFLAAVVALGLGVPGLAQDGFDIARIYIEYNQSANDLGFHVTLDGEEWTDLKIYDPTGTKIFDLSAKGGYKNLGLTELFFEGAEPNLSEFPLEELLALFPEGEYTFIGKTVDNEKLVSTATLSHDVPDGPDISTAPSPRAPARSRSAGHPSRIRRRSFRMGTSMSSHTRSSSARFRSPSRLRARA